MTKHDPNPDRIEPLPDSLLVKSPLCFYRIVEDLPIHVKQLIAEGEFKEFMDSCRSRLLLKQSRALVTDCCVKGIDKEVVAILERIARHGA
ncbi:hypothetical protein BMJ25_06660 [Sinorhizobium medicae]|nr:hypothetical protein BMJ25_06660 [Sinorhizobium medicae]